MRNQVVSLALLAGLAVHAPQLAAAADPLRVSIEAQPAAIELGGEGPQESSLTITVSDTGGRPWAQSDVLLHTTAGTIAELQRVGPGRFTARLLPPRDIFPQLAVITAADTAAATHGLAPAMDNVVVAFSARLDLKGRAEAGARMRVGVGKRTFGPVHVDASGVFAIPIVVPPGENWATGTSSDSIGNTSRSRINLYLPEVRRVHGFVFPAQVVADGRDRAWLFVTTVGFSGAPENARVRVEAARGTLGQPERIAPGILRYPYSAPAGVGAGADRITLRRDGQREHVDFEVALVADAPAKLEAHVEPAIVPADGVSSATVVVRASDARGSAATGHAVQITVDGQTLEATETALGEYRVSVPPRQRIGVSKIGVRLQPRAGVCRRPQVVQVEGRAKVVDGRALPCGGAYALFDASGKLGKEGALAADGEVGAWEAIRAALAAGERLEVRGALPAVAVLGPDGAAAARPATAELTLTWRVPSAVTLRLRKVRDEGNDLVVRLEAENATALAERVEVSSSSGTVQVLGVTASSLDIVVRGPSRPLDVVANDRPTGVSAWLRVQ